MFPRYKHLLILLPLLAAVLACRLQPGSAQPTATLTRPPSATYTITPSATPIPSNTSTASPTVTPTATSTFTPTSSPTATFTPSPTLTTTPSFTPTSTPPPLEVQLDVFEELWHIVDEEYLYPDFNGLDWKAVHVEYRQRIEAGLDNLGFYDAMAEMIYSLGDDHSRFLTPEQTTANDAEFAGKMDYVGVGIILAAVPERQRAVIYLVFPDSPAKEAGLKIHDNIISVNGEPILDSDGNLRMLLLGPEGTTASVEVQTPGEEPRTISITRRRIAGPVPVPYMVLTSPAGKRIGYILLETFMDSTVDDQVGAALKVMSADGPLDGLILDNRINEGGIMTVLVGTLRYFSAGIVGHFVNRQSQSALDLGQPKDVAGSQTVPMVVMVGPDTVSFGEISSGILQDTGRAYIIGEKTMGNVELLYRYNFPDGSSALIAHDRFQPLNHPDTTWEGVGIKPDLSVPAPWDLYTTDSDPAIKAALDYFDSK